MPLFIAAAIPFWAAGATAAGSVIGAKLSANAQRDAAQLATDAASHAADVQAKAAADTLAFQKEQAAQQRAVDEVNRRANYEQWATQRRQFQSLDQLVGNAPREIPGYVPTTETAAGGQPGAASGTGAAPSIDATKGDIGTQISAYFKSRGVSDHETPYWVQKWPELVARGKELNDPSYAVKRLAAADVFGGGGGSSSSASTAAKVPNSLDATAGNAAQGFGQYPITPALQPSTMRLPTSLEDYAIA